MSQEAGGRKQEGTYTGNRPMTGIHLEKLRCGIGLKDVRDGLLQFVWMVSQMNEAIDSSIHTVMHLGGIVPATASVPTCPGWGLVMCMAAMTVCGCISRYWSTCRMTVVAASATWPS